VTADRVLARWVGRRAKLCSGWSVGLPASAQPTVGGAVGALGLLRRPKLRFGAAISRLGRRRGPLNWV